MAEQAAWRISHASVIGSSHERTGVECQDYCGYELREEALILFAADGAGTASRSREGAEFVCRHFVEHFSARLDDLASLGETDCQAWIGAARQALATHASTQEAALKDYACTFLGGILGGAASLFLQIGDGAIVVSCREEPNEYDPVVWPEQGDYANMTFFVTAEDAERHLQVAAAGPVDEVALFTDGLQRLALHMATKSAHSPFFRTFFGRLRSEPPGHSERISSGMAAFLASAPVLQRTDDDKSLVLATRLVMGKEPN